MINTKYEYEVLMKKILLLASLLTYNFASAKSFLDEVADIVDTDPQVSINLGSGLLKAALSFADDGDKDVEHARGILNNLDKIQVTVYELGKNTNTRRLNNLINDEVSSLSRNGYEKIVTVRDGDENVNILAKVENDYLHDALVLVMDGDDELVIISFDGSLNLKQMAQISGKFDIDLDLDDLVNL